MPTNLKRVNVSLPKEIQLMLEKEASFNQRPLANQVLWILDQYFYGKKKEMDYFRPTLPSEVEHDRTPFYSVRPALEAEAPKKPQRSQDQEGK